MIHSVWRRGTDDYFDPMNGVSTHWKRYQTFIEALQTHDCVVLQKTADDGSFARLGYIGVFRFTDLKVGADGSISLKLLERMPIRPA